MAVLSIEEVEKLKNGALETLKSLHKKGCNEFDKFIKHELDYIETIEAQRQAWSELKDWLGIGSEIVAKLWEKEEKEGSLSESIRLQEKHNTMKMVLHKAKEIEREQAQNATEAHECVKARELHIQKKDGLKIENKRVYEGNELAQVILVDLCDYLEKEHGELDQKYWDAIREMNLTLAEWFSGRVYSVVNIIEKLNSMKC